MREEDDPQLALESFHKGDRWLGDEVCEGVMTILKYFM